MTAGKGLPVKFVLCVSGNINRKGIARLVCNNQCMLIIIVCTQIYLTVAVRIFFISVQSYLIYIFLINFNCCFLTESIMSSISHILNHRCGRVDFKAVG